MAILLPKRWWWVVCKPIIVFSLSLGQAEQYLYKVCKNDLFQHQDFPGGDSDVSVPSITDQPAGHIMKHNGDGQKTTEQLKKFACEYCDKLFNVQILLLQFYFYYPELLIFSASNNLY